jgi:hypothetical protein
MLFFYTVATHKWKRAGLRRPPTLCQICAIFLPKHTVIDRTFRMDRMAEGVVFVESLQFSPRSQKLRKTIK